MAKQFNIPSLKKRFLWKLFISGMSGGLSLISLPLVSRSLGPVDYGIFNFLRFSFEKLIQFFDIGNSAFYPFFSRRPGDRSILRFWILYDLILFAVSVFVLIALMISGEIKEILTTDSLSVIAFTFAFVWLFIINGKLVELMDALGRTIVNESVQFTMRIMLTGILAILFFIDKLNIQSYLITQNLVFIIFVIALAFLAKKYIPKEQDSKPLKKTAIEFKNYSKPLLISSIVGIFTGLGDRWILQIFGGAEQQGFYSFGLNLGAVCFLLTGSVTPLLIREYAIAHSNHDVEKIARLFSKFLPVFYMLTATISCFLATHGDWVSSILGGSDFKKASFSVMLMALTPIHQTYGQLSGGLMIATDRTKIYGQISMFVALIGVPITYFSIAPSQYFGLDLGAIGLAIKILFVQILTVNIQIWFNTRYLGIRMLNFVIQQGVIVFLLISIGFISKLSVMAFMEPSLVALLLSGGFYMTIILVTVYIFPNIISLTREEIMDYIKAQLALIKTKSIAN